MNPLNTQIKNLVEEHGYTAEQIAMGYNLPLEAVKLVIAGLNIEKKKAQSFEERFEDVEEIAMECLKDIVRTGMNESARVAASKILLEKKESLNNKVNFDIDQICERLKRSKDVSSSENNIIEMEKVG